MQYPAYLDRFMAQEMQLLGLALEHLRLLSLLIK